MSTSELITHKLSQAWRTSVSKSGLNHINHVIKLTKN